MISYRVTVQLKILVVKIFWLPYSRKVWRTNSFWSFGERKFGYLRNQPTDYWLYVIIWMVLVGQIMGDSQNSPNFLPTKLSRYMVIWWITAICWFFANFHYFQSIPYTNGLQFNKVFSNELPTVLIRQTFFAGKLLLYYNYKQCKVDVFGGPRPLLVDLESVAS